MENERLVEQQDPLILEQAPEEIDVASMLAIRGAEEQRTSMATVLAKRAIGAVLDEYLQAANYFVDIGAQVSNEHYGGSRSMVYRQMIGRAATLSELWQARQEYKACHRENESNHDEFGGVLRIAGYRLRNFPGIGSWLEKKVRADDQVMAGAQFDYPDDIERVSGRIR